MYIIVLLQLICNHHLRCCYEHDACYDKLTDNKICNAFQLYAAKYEVEGCTDCGKSFSEK